MMYSKDVKTFSLREQRIEDWQLSKINTFALTQLSSEDIYVRQFLLAHTGIDRDNERFSEGVLEDFRRTLAGKSVLQGHNRNDLPKGLFFDAFVDVMDKNGFKILTGEDIRLPANIERVSVLWGWVYFPKVDLNKDILALIEGGVCRYVSIGFKASGLYDVQDTNGNYMEYQAPAEALEGSIVWLGAQPGAIIKNAQGFKTAESRKRDYTQDNPLTPRKDLFKSESILAPCNEPHKQKPLPTFQDEEKESSRDYSKNNPLTPRKVKEDPLEDHTDYWTAVLRSMYLTNLRSRL